MVLIAVPGVEIQAENSVKYFEEGENKTGGVIDNEVIFIYKKEVNIDKKGSLKILQKIAQKQLCEKKDTRMIIVEAKMSVKYIYMFEGSATIVKIDNCKGVKVK